MKEHVEPFDTRFRFVHWDVRHAFFNDGTALRLEDVSALPVPEQFDVIWLFSVFTHLDESDARAMLRLLRQAVRREGRLLFTAFIDPDLDGVENRGPDHPLHMVFFGRRTIERILAETGWTLRSFHPVGSEPFIQPCFVCSRDDDWTAA